MFKNKVFWGAFLDGLASPWSFWGARPDYQRLVHIPTVAETFSQVGASMSAGYGVNIDERARAATASSHHLAAAE